MSSFFDRIKKGAADAGSKAKILVDINRIKLQISQKEKEIDEQYGKLGKVVFDAFQNTEPGNMEEVIRDYCSGIIAIKEDITRKQQEIDELNTRMNESEEENVNTNTGLSEKKCICGKAVVKGAKFCPFCGYSFQNEAAAQYAKEEAEPDENKCPECGTVVVNGANFCGSCGHMMNK